MKKTMKKILCTLLVVVMCLTSAPLQGFVGMKWPELPEINFGELKLPELDFSKWFVSEAKAADYTSGIYTYTLSGNNATITKCNSSVSGKLTVPSTLDGYTVVSIGNSAFSGMLNMTSVVIPDSVKNLGSHAFSGCTRLSSIDLGNVESLGYYVFDGCTSLKNITIPKTLNSCDSHGPFANSVIETVVIEKGIANIPAYLFSSCTTLKSVTLPEKDDTDILGGYKIGFRAFYNCSSLVSIDLPESLTIIEEDAFSGCSSLAGITIPDEVATIGNEAFYGCKDLLSTYIGKSVTSIGHSAFGGCVKLTSVVIPDSVESLGSHAFSGCTRLSSIDLGNVESLGYYVFDGCTSLKNITIPKTLNSCDSYGPFANSVIETVVIEKGIANIPSYLFYNCTTLNNVTLPKSITTINNYAFYNCTSLTDVYYEGSETEWSKITIGSNNTYLTDATIHYNCVMPDSGSEEDDEDVSINTEAENEAFIQQHLLFRKAYYDYFTNNLRWASEVWNHMNTGFTFAAELAYDIVEGALEIVTLQFLDGLEVAANPYDVILLDFLASNVSQSHFAKNAEEDALTVAVDIVNKAIKIFSDDSNWEPDFDIKKEVKLLITSSDYSQNNLYLALDNLHSGDYSDEITKIFNGFDCFGQVMKAVTAGAKFADMFVELLRYTVAIEGFYNSTAVFKSVLDAIASEMEVNNPVFASYFSNALEFYEESLTYDSIVDYVIKNKGIGDTAKLIYDMSTNVISNATVSFIMKAFKVGKDVARKVNAALWSAEVGWGLSNLLTGNNVSIGCRRMLRATYALDVATYNVMERFRTILDRDESYGAALCFDSSFNIFKMTQLYSLEQYKKYCENMATRPFTFNKSEFKNADEFLTAATVTWKNINCHYIEGTSSFNAALVDTLRVACPTNIYVYRKSDNKLVASVINNKSTLYDDSVAILCIDGEKSFAATDMDDYRIEIKATDNGTMDVIYNSYSDFKNTKKLSFDDVPIKSGNKYELDDEKESIKRDDNVEYKTDGRVDNCSCNCHKGGIAGFFFKLILFFQKIFKTNKTCSCGVAHY